MATKTARKTKTNKPAKSGVKLDSHQVILRPMVTEKGIFQSTEMNQYTFEVNPLATKTDIKSAIEELFEVKVASVGVQNRKGKPRRYKFKYGRTKGYKKAIVRLKGDDRIDFF